MGFYQIAQGILVQVDSEEVENTFNSLKNARLPVIEKIAAYKRIAGIAQEIFANGWYDNWVEELRTYFQGIYEDALIHLANWYIDHRQFRHSLIYLKKIIKADYYNETYQRLFLQTLKKMGKNIEARHHYELFEKKLQKELSCKPQPETVELHKNL
jgi:two-component SAPR family response regulator